MDIQTSTRVPYPFTRLIPGHRPFDRRQFFLHFVTLWPWPFDLIISVVGYPKIIPYTKLNTLGSLVFELSCRAGRHREIDAAKRFTPASVVGASKKYRSSTVQQSKITSSVYRPKTMVHAVIREKYWILSLQKYV